MYYKKVRRTKQKKMYSNKVRRTKNKLVKTRKYTKSVHSKKRVKSRTKVVYGGGRFSFKRGKDDDEPDELPKEGYVDKDIQDLYEYLEFIQNKPTYKGTIGPKIIELLGKMPPEGIGMLHGIIIDFGYGKSFVKISGETSGQARAGEDEAEGEEDGEEED
jgi:hypothetical protein